MAINLNNVTVGDSRLFKKQTVSSGLKMNLTNKLKMNPWLYRKDN